MAAYGHGLTSPLKDPIGQTTVAAISGPAAFTAPSDLATQLWHFAQALPNGGLPNAFSNSHEVLVITPASTSVSDSHSHVIAGSDGLGSETETLSVIIKNSLSGNTNPTGLHFTLQLSPNNDPTADLEQPIAAAFQTTHLYAFTLTPTHYISFASNRRNEIHR